MLERVDRDWWRIGGERRLLGLRGLLLQRANEAIVVHENQREDVEVDVGSVLIAVNREPTGGSPYDKAVGMIAAAAWPVTLGFIRAPTRSGSLLKKRAAAQV